MFTDISWEAFYKDSEEGRRIMSDIGKQVQLDHNVDFKGKEGRKEVFYLTTLSTHFIDGYMASDIW